MRLPLEAVPNFSEGRDEATLSALATPLDGRGVRLLDVHADADHNRSVFTLVGEDGPLQDALVGAVAVARDRIDLRRHEGVHPRVGAADVVPVVPLRAGDMPRAKRTARLVAKRITAELGVTTFLYGEVGDGRGPAFFRRGGLAELQRRLDDGEVEPAYGSPDLDPGTGAALVGARRPLVAFNVNLRGADLAVAREIAAVVRETGGGFAGVRALGLELRSAGHAQVSMNVEDWEAAALHQIVGRIGEEARARGAEIAGSELVGLMPAGAAAAAAGSVLRIEGFGASRLVELHLLEDLAE